MSEAIIIVFLSKDREQSEREGGRNRDVWMKGMVVRMQREIACR